jgi:hypothetical protein
MDRMDRQTDGRTYRTDGWTDKLGVQMDRRIDGQMDR